MIIALCLLIFNFAHARRCARALSSASVYHTLSSTRPGTRVHLPSVVRASVKLPVSCTVCTCVFLHNMLLFFYDQKYSQWAAFTEDYRSVVSPRVLQKYRLVYIEHTQSVCVGVWMCVCVCVCVCECVCVCVCV